MLDSIVDEARFAWRGVKSEPSFAIVAVVILALGLSASVSILGLAHAVLARMLPAVAPDRLVAVYQTRDGSGAHPMSYPDYLDYRDQSFVLESLASHYSAAPLNAVADARAAMLQGSVVSDNFFSLLGVEPLLGRFFLPEENETPGAHPVCVLSFGLWQRWFGGMPSALGRRLELNGTAFTIVGVAPEGFWGTLVGVTNDVWIPSMMSRVGYRFCDPYDRDCTYVNVIGRLRDGEGLEDARAELAVVANRLAAAWPETHEGTGVLAVPARGMRPGDAERSMRLIRVLTAVVLLVLVAACANLAGMLLARNLGRRREVAIRLALGASRGRIIQRLLAETLIVSSLGGALGLVLAAWAQSFLVPFVGIEARWVSTGFELPVVLGAFTLALGSGLLIGAWPSFDASRVALVPALKEGGTRGGTARARLRSVLLVSQVGVCLALLGGAGRLVESVRGVVAAPPYRPREVLSLRLRPRLADYDGARAELYLRKVLTRVESLPSVRAASLSLGQPYAPYLAASRVAALANPDSSESLLVASDAVAPRYFETLGLPLLRGRELLDSDRAGSAPVVILNESLASRLFVDADAVGETVIIEGAPYRVVGVVADAQPRGYDSAPPFYFYRALWQAEAIDARMSVRVRSEPSLEIVLAAIAAVDPQVPVTEVSTLEEKLEARFRPLELASVVSRAAGASVLLLTAVGLYGLLAFIVHQRSREIAIRRALGAESPAITRMVVGQGIRLSARGLVVGLALSMLLSPLLQNFLFAAAVESGPWASYGKAALMVIAITVVATLIPSRRALAIDATRALHDE